MPIIYDKLFALLEKKGYTSYTIRKTNLIGQGTITALRNGRGLTSSTLERLCDVLDCQPGDLMEYVRDTKEDQKAEADSGSHN